MKVVILAGGLPSTVSGEDEKIPKPMAEIGGRPILWHIMKQYCHYGFRDFIVCAGYKGEMIKQYFMDYYIYQSDITVDLQKNEVKIHRRKTEDWNVSVIDTGRDTSAVERIKCVREHLGGEPFIVTYGDCVSDIDIGRMAAFHKENGKCATVAVAHPAGRSEILPIGAGNEVQLKDKGWVRGDAWANACSMVFEPSIFSYMSQEPSHFFEDGLFRALSGKKEILAYKHEGFWSPMETRRDRSQLEWMWKEGKAPWRVWETD